MTDEESLIQRMKKAIRAEEERRKKRLQEYIGIFLGQRDGLINILPSENTNKGEA